MEYNFKNAKIGDVFYGAIESRDVIRYEVEKYPFIEFHESKNTEEKFYIHSDIGGYVWDKNSDIPNSDIPIELFGTRSDIPMKFFTTRKETAEYEKQQFKNVKDSYRKSICSLEELIKFMYKYCMMSDGDYRVNFAANDVAKEKIEEFRN